MKTFIIGDVHGGLLGLKQVLERAPISTEDTLIFLGDYVDGWSESAQVIDFLIELKETYKCLFIKGNHDHYTSQWLETGSTKNQSWLMHGGEATIESYRNHSETDRKAHFEFIDSMPIYHIDSKNRLFIHAGFANAHGPQREFKDQKTPGRWDRTLWEMVIATDKSLPKSSVLYPKRVQLFDEIFIGHTPTTNYNSPTPMNALNVWNIDTGAAFKGKITVMDIETKEYWQSEPVYELYPNEEGRNCEKLKKRYKEYCKMKDK